MAITGAARGIGSPSPARRESGATVAIWDMDAGRAEAAAALGRASAHALDLTDEAAIATALAATLTAHGRIDILVNNAGITGGNAPSWELPIAEWRRVIEVNLVAPYMVARAVVPTMITAGYGRVVNIASIAGKEGNPNVHYSASKAGLIGFTKSLGKEWRSPACSPTASRPPPRRPTFKQMTEQQIAWMRSKIPMDRFVEVEEIAAMACWLASEDCSFSTGAVFDISGGRAVY